MDAARQRCDRNSGMDRRPRASRVGRHHAGADPMRSHQDRRRWVKEMWPTIPAPRPEERLLSLRLDRRQAGGSEGLRLSREVQPTRGHGRGPDSPVWRVPPNSYLRRAEHVGMAAEDVEPILLMVEANHDV